MSEHYILDENKNAVPCGLLEWAAFFENNANRRVAEDRFDGVYVSTVFLGLNHRFGYGEPLIFETMIFTEGEGILDDEYQERCSTWAEALEMHAAAVRFARRRLKAKQAEGRQ